QDANVVGAQASTWKREGQRRQRGTMRPWCDGKARGTAGACQPRRPWFSLRNEGTITLMRSNVLAVVLALAGCTVAPRANQGGADVLVAVPRSGVTVSPVEDGHPRRVGPWS